MLTDVDSWLQTIENTYQKSATIGLENFVTVARQLKLLPFDCPVITVAGTNGKGSTVALLEKILLLAGNNVGTFTSPHLYKYNERIRINGHDITHSALCQAFAVIHNSCSHLSLSYFEFTTLVAFYLFKHQQPDFLILEVGLGGRLDAVNAVDADIAIISTIALDHTEQLGQTREAIGFEKAGIMRAHKPVICGDFDIPTSIREQARKCDATLMCMNEDFYYEKTSKQFWTWHTRVQRFDNLPIPRIELQNAATALQAIVLLQKKFQISREVIEQGLQTVFIPARLQIITGNITQIIDVAHNPAAGEWLAKQVSNLFSLGKTHAVVAMLSDKDRVNTLKPLIPLVDYWHTASLDQPRGGTGLELVAILKSLAAKNITNYYSVRAAYDAACEQTMSQDRIIIFGSFKTVAQITAVKI